MSVRKSARPSVRPAAPAVHNHTPYTPEQVAGLVLLGRTVSSWRQRNISLYQHPEMADQVVSVGVTFDQAMTVLSVEPKSAWVTALAYAARGHVYISQ